MKKLFLRIKSWIKRVIKAITPGSNAMKGAAFGLFIVTASLWLLFNSLLVINLRDGWILILGLGLSILVVLAGFVARWLINGFNKLPKLFRLSLFMCIPLLVLLSNGPVIMITLLTLGILSGASILVLKLTGFNNLTIPRKIVTLLGLIIGFGGFITLGYFYSQVGFEVDPMENAALFDNPEIESIVASSPAEQGRFPVLTLTYGSGKDRHRTEFGEEVTIVTDSVNGVSFIDNWDGFSGWWRKKYWGFDAWSLPINGRVWYPEGEGPFPLVLVVHGNHGMQDYSDPGYDYLGELLASRGIILASVDENFINGSWSDLIGGSLSKENDARGWLLLEHLRVWHEWNSQEGHAFFNKIDTSRLALMGHSRGGEAVAHAAFFNKLPYYPDDASIAFDYNFNIQSIVAIAPVDGQYKPGDSRTEIEDVNYFVFHGSQDADVRSFMGAQQFERVSFTDSSYRFKSALYIYGANHGQFNTSWGNNDTGMPFTGALNLKQLLTKEDQEQVAKVYISAFLESTLNDKKEYLPLFLDARKGKDWLPNTIYLTEFEDSSLDLIADFEEDFDVSTVTKEGEVMTNNLTVWREEEIELKWQQKGSRALVIGWDYETENDSIESVADSLIASYTINLSNSYADSASVLVFSMTESTESSNPKSKGKWIRDENDNEEEESEVDEEDEDEDDGEDKKDEEEKADSPIDFTIQVTDSSGQILTFPLSSFSSLQREINVVIMKADFITGDNESEKIFQTFYFPLRELKQANPEFDPSMIQSVSFVFDRTTDGVVMIDEVGFMKKL